MVQMSTACYLALEKKAETRKIGKKHTSSITSVKAGDLLATPTEHWKLIMSSNQQLADYLYDFQMTVAGGLFPWKWCPYPVTSSIYVALRFHSYFDDNETHKWQLDDLAPLFKAFFWRNSLTNRYDQGFLTQIGVDIKELKNILNKRRNYATFAQWALAIEQELSQLIGRPLPSQDDLIEFVTDGRPGGAMQKALYLPILAAAEKDLLDDTISLKYPQQEFAIQLHHIYPRDWCRNNKVGRLVDLLDESIAGRDWVNSLCNLMPLSRKSNNIWKSKNPGLVLNERQIEYTYSSKILNKACIDEECFMALRQGAEGLNEFWKHRAELIVEKLMALTKIMI